MDTVSSAPNAAGSPERFGYSWARFDKILPVHEEQFRRWTSVVEPSKWKGADVLDVGCGMGRNSYWAAKWGARSVTAIDLDERSLAAARRNLAGLGNVTVGEVSAYDIPDRDRYDIAFSIGVIHHLGDPPRALARMVRAAKPGGQVMIWVYGLENNEWIVRYFSPLRRMLFSRMPLWLVFQLSAIPSAGLWIALRLGLGRLPYHDLLRQLSFDHLRATVFDQMIPKISNHWSREEVEALLRDSGLEDVESVWVNEMSWSARGRKPVAADPAG